MFLLPHEIPSHLLIYTSLTNYWFPFINSNYPLLSITILFTLLMSRLREGIRLYWWFFGVLVWVWFVVGRMGWRRFCLFFWGLGFRWICTFVCGLGRVICRKWLCWWMGGMKSVFSTIILRRGDRRVWCFTHVRRVKKRSSYGTVRIRRKSSTRFSLHSCLQAWPNTSRTACLASTVSRESAAVRMHNSVEILWTELWSHSYFHMDCRGIRRLIRVCIKILPAMGTSWSHLTIMTVLVCTPRKSHIRKNAFIRKGFGKSRQRRGLMNLLIW